MQNSLKMIKIHEQSDALEKSTVYPLPFYGFLTKQKFIRDFI